MRHKAITDLVAGAGPSGLKTDQDDRDHALTGVAITCRPFGPSRVLKNSYLMSRATNLECADYWSVKISARDGFSGSPVYNEKGEVVGVFSGYDWSQRLAVISPGVRAQKLLAAYAPNARP